MEPQLQTVSFFSHNVESTLSPTTLISLCPQSPVAYSLLSNLIVCAPSFFACVPLFWTCLCPTAPDWGWHCTCTWAETSTMENHSKSSVCLRLKQHIFVTEQSWQRVIYPNPQIKGKLSELESVRFVCVCFFCCCCCFFADQLTLTSNCKFGYNIDC